MLKVKCAIPNEEYRWAPHLPFLGHEPVGGYTEVCDARPNLPSCWASPPLDWYQIILIGTCLQCFDTVGWVAGRASGL